MKKSEYGNKLTDMTTGFCNLFFLNILYLLVSIPIITHGAAKRAFYICVDKVRQEEDIKVLKDFFREFKAGWKLGSILMVLELIILSILVFDWLYYSQANGSLQKFLLPVLIIITIIALAYRGMAYLLSPQLEYDSYLQLLKNIFLTILAKPFHAMAIAIIQVIAVLILYIVPLKVLASLLCLIFGIGAFLITIIIDKILVSISPEIRVEEQELYLL